MLAPLPDHLLPIERFTLPVPHFRIREAIQGAPSRMILPRMA